MKISQRPSARSMVAASAATAFLLAPIAAAVWWRGRHGGHPGLTIAFWMVVIVVVVLVEELWLLGVLKRWVWSQHVRLTITANPGEVFSRPFIIDKGAKFETADGTVYESIEGVDVPIGATKTDVVVRRITP